MRISSVSVLFLFCLGTAVSEKTTGLRALMQEYEADCLHHFNTLDVDKDNVLTIQDIIAVIDYLINEKGIGANEVRTFAHDLSDADYDNDGQIDKQEFMIACEGQKHAEKKAQLKSALKENTWEKAKKDLEIKRAQHETQESGKVVKKAAKKAEMVKEAALKECAGFFERMDVDQDGELSLQDLKTVIDSKIKNNVDISKLREFVNAMAALDLNNDEIIDNGEFMSACLND